MKKVLVKYSKWLYNNLGSERRFSGIMPRGCAEIERLPGYNAAESAGAASCSCIMLPGLLPRDFTGKRFRRKSFARKFFTQKSFTRKSFTQKSFMQKSFTRKSFTQNNFFAEMKKVLVKYSKWLYNNLGG